MTTADETIAADPEVFESAAALDDRRFLTKARRFAARIPFARHAVAMYHAMRDEETPIAAKSVIVGALAYFVMPIDLVPDFVAALGFTDDAAVIAAALKTISTYMKPHHYEAADETLQG